MLSQITYLLIKFQHPVMMVLMTMGVAMVGYGLARGFRYYVKCQRKSMLEAPPDLAGSEHEDSAAAGEEELMPEKSSHAKYTKAQARQRFKKGRSS
jgi:hypothetical protein